MHQQVSLGWMAPDALWVQRVAVASTDALPGEASGPLEIDDDSAGPTFGDPAGVGDVPHACFGSASDQRQHSGMHCEERPVPLAAHDIPTLASAGAALVVSLCRHTAMAGCGQREGLRVCRC
jgi:hypothetical protein